MALTPSSFTPERGSGKPCGASHIPKGDKCHKGAATPASRDSTAKKVAVGTVVGAIATFFIAKHRWTPQAAQRLQGAKTAGSTFTAASAPPQAKFLAKGAYGKVYVSADRKSIFKVIQDRRGMRMFGREIDGHINAQHLGVRTPKIKAVDMTKGLVEMEFLDGYNTIDKLYSSSNNKQRQAVRDSLIAEMSKLHRAGWGHGDFHKGNIMFKDGEAAVLDWGFTQKSMLRVKEDIWRLIGVARKLSPSDQEAKIYEIGERFMNLRNHTDVDVRAFYNELNKSLGVRSDTSFTPITLRLDLKCGNRRNDTLTGPRFNGDAAAHPLYGTTYIDPARPRGDAEGDGKKYSKTVTNPETGRKNKVRYGAKGYKIAPGTNKGDRYCARSFGDMKSHNKNCAGKDRNTPLCLSRAKWKCSGKTSRRDEGLTPGKS